ncbi:LarC family nickel insertion protein [Devosia nitrariae]|nr:LarC family nickel insertion protein [Devosia nitrariae]
MMHVHLDAVGGIAGDMFVAAMIDAFPSLEDRVLADACAAVPPMAGVPVFTTGSSGAIACRRFGLRPSLGAALAGTRLGQAPAQFSELRATIAMLELSDGTAGHAVGILTLLAEAESAIHGVPVDQVHFHELAGWDSLLDVVAAGSIIAALRVARWTVSPLPRGGGLVRTQHGMLPVPAPAATRLLEGFAFRDDAIDGERVTPTGAAILKYIDARSTGRGEGRLTCSGTGAGTRELKGMPNILRALVFDTYEADGDRVTVINFEVDDMTGEEIGTASDLLRTTPGVLDVTVGHMLGKKQRPMTAFQVLATPCSADAIMDACLSLTSTIGLRWHETARRTLSRSLSASGGVRTKSVGRPGGEVTIKAENDDIAGHSLAQRRRNRALAETPGDV